MEDIFITVEGGEGTGKTTMIENIKAYFVDRGFDVIITREPGGIKISEQIRKVILDTENTEMDAKTEALLYAAARRQHLVQKVLPALKEGKVVICDRFVDSSLVYQGNARGLGIKNVMNVNEFAIDGCMPSLTILLDLDPEVGLARIDADKGREINRLDLEKIDFHNKVREGYLKLAETYKDRIVKVDASGSKEEVFSAVKVVLDGKFPKNEIEKKFLVNKELIPEELLKLEPKKIVQKYLALKPEKRIRLTSYKGKTKANLTIKTDGTLCRGEEDKEISLEEYNKLDNNVLGTIIKDRFIYDLGNSLKAEVDFYIELGNQPEPFGKENPLVTVEVEFETISDANSFIKPIWFGEDVTEDSRFKNKNLAISKK